MLSLFILTANALLPTFARADGEAQAAQGTVSGFVTPTEVHEKEPFTMASQGSVEGEVVEVKTIDGEVVATKKTDKLGRIFLAAGLAAGTYLLTKAGGDKNAPKTPIEIQPGPPAGQSGGHLEIPKPPQFSNLKDGLKLAGSGIDPNAAQMSISCGATQIPVLAATASEIKTGPLSDMPPGSYDLKVKNLANGESVACNGMVVYDAQSRLTRKQLTNGQATQLEFQLLPDFLKGTVKAKITSGPVHFGGGAQEKEIEVGGGEPKALPILANASGMGKFTVSWELSGIMMEPKPNPNPGQDQKKEPCPAEEHRLVPGAWQRAQEGKKFVAWRRMQCYIFFNCSKPKGHAGEHDFADPKRCTKREKFTDANGNGVWDANDGDYTDDNGNGRPDAGEYDDKNGDGKYNPPEKFEDGNKNGSYDGDHSEKKYFDTKDERDQYIKDHP